MKSWPGCRPKCPLGRSITPPDEGPRVECGFTLSHAEETGGIIIPLVRFYTFSSQNSYSLGQSLCAKLLGLLISVSLPRKPLCFFFSWLFCMLIRKEVRLSWGLGLLYSISRVSIHTNTHTLQPNSRCGWPPSLLNIKDIPPPSFFFSGHLLRVTACTPWGLFLLSSTKIILKLLFESAWNFFFFFFFFFN